MHYKGIRNLIFLYGWMRLARAMDKNEDIVFSTADKETQLIVNILLYDIISMLCSCVLIWLLHCKNLLMTQGVFPEFCTAVIGKGLMTNPQPGKRMT